MNRKTISLIWTIIIYGGLIGLFLWISVDIKAKKDEFVMVGFQKVENRVTKGLLTSSGGSEGVFSPFGDVPIQLEKTKKSLNPLEKPSYKGGELLRRGEGNGKFKLIGELSKRELIHFEKPKYPTGANANTEVKLQISANPDGTIKTIDILKTGGLLFDQSAIQAVREWRFQPLPPFAEQKVQSGIVTIYFEIK